MAFQVSTGLRNKLLDTSSLKTAMNLSFIKIYAGTAPASADAAIGSATLLTTISNNSTGTGVTLDTAASGVIPKNPSEVWSGLNVASGTATFFRWVAAGDDGTLSTTQSRVQGTVAVLGGDMNISSVGLTSGATQTIDVFNWTLPTY